MHQLIAYAPRTRCSSKRACATTCCWGDHHQDAIETWLRLGLTHLLERPDGLDAPLALAQDPFSGGEIHRLGLLRAWLRTSPSKCSMNPRLFWMPSPLRRFVR